MILGDLYQYLNSLSICQAIYPSSCHNNMRCRRSPWNSTVTTTHSYSMARSKSLKEALVTVNIYDPSILVANNLATT